MFKSSANPSGKDIFTAMEPAGATINATTSFDRTNFYCTYGFQFFSKWCKAEAVRMQTAPFTEQFDSKERAVVQDELRIGKGNPYSILRSQVMQAAFARGPYEIDTGGFARDVGTVSFDRLKAFHKDFYGPNNAHVVVVGRMKPAAILKHVAEHFKDIPSEGRVPKRIERSEEVQDGTRQVLVNSDIPVCMLMMSYRNVAGTNRDSIVSEVIAAYLSHPSVGVLSQLSDMGIVPEATCDNGRQKNRFLFSIVGALSADVPQLQQVTIGMIHAALEKLKTQPIDREVLRIVKKQISNKWNNSVQSVEALGSQLTEAIAMGNLDDVWQRHKVLNTVSVDDLQRVSQYLFQEERMTLGIIKRRQKPSVKRPEAITAMSTPQFNAPRAVDMYLQASKQYAFKPMKEQGIMNAPFGLFHRLELNTSDRVQMLITAKSSTQNDALAKVAATLIREGLPKIKLSHSKAAPLSVYRAEQPAAFADIKDSFQTYMIENNIQFEIAAPQGKLQFQIAFDGSSDPSTVLQRVAKAIKSLDYTSQEHAQEIQMKSQQLLGKWKGAALDPRFLSEKEITERLFAKEDINRSIDPEELVKELSSITFSNIEDFKNSLLSMEEKPLVVSVAARSDLANEKLAKAVKEFHEILSPKFYEGDRDYEEKHLPFGLMPSMQQKVSSNEKYLVRQLDGRMEGLSAIGTRVDLNKNDPEYTALAVGLMCLGGGMNSLYNDVLRKEHGWTYGAYARMRGGDHSSSSWVYSFASFDMQKMPMAVPKMRQIYEKFCNEGISKEDFEVKRSNFELSMKVRMENKSALLGLTHQAVLNGCKTNFKDIMDRSQKVTYEECNRIIKKHLQGKEFIHVLCGDFKKTGVEVL